MWVNEPELAGDAVVQVCDQWMVPEITGETGLEPASQAPVLHDWRVRKQIWGGPTTTADKFQIVDETRQKHDAFIKRPNFSVREVDHFQAPC